MLYWVLKLHFLLFGCTSSAQFEKDKGWCKRETATFIFKKKGKEYRIVLQEIDK